MSSQSSSPSVIPFCFESQEVRALTIEGEPWFVAKDVCDVLDLGTEQVRRLDEDEKGLRKVQTLGGQQDIISESGLYTLIIRSNKPQAKPFRKWVTAEVLPSIRKTGAYALPGSSKHAEIHHHRHPKTKTGLDIRFTCDLTKVLSKRNPSDLELLERLTGIGLGDLAATETVERTRSEVQEVFSAFAADCLIDDERCAVLFRDLYEALVIWYGQAGYNLNLLPSAKGLSLWLERSGYVRRKPSGNATVYGLRIREGA